MNTFWKYTTLGMIISATVSGCGSGPTDGDEAVEATTGALSNDPSLIRTGSDCGTQTIPGAEQVLIYSGFNFSGTCKVLLPGFYPLPANMNIPNDSLRSLKLGSAVRVRAFDDQIYGGASSTVAVTTASFFAFGASSMRVEDASRSSTCNDTRRNEVTFKDGPAGGDCVSVPAGGFYPDPQHMGIRNDSVSTIVYFGSSLNYSAYVDANFQRKCFGSDAAITFLVGTACDNTISSWRME